MKKKYIGKSIATIATTVISVIDTAQDAYRAVIKAGNDILYVRTDGDIIKTAYKIG